MIVTTMVAELHVHLLQIENENEITIVFTDKMQKNVNSHSDYRIHSANVKQHKK